MQARVSRSLFWDNLEERDHEYSGGFAPLKVVFVQRDKNFDVLMH